MHLFSRNLSAIAVISSSILLELSPAPFSCINNFNLSQNSLGLSGKMSLEIPEAMISGDSSNLPRDFSLLPSRPIRLITNFNSHPNS